MKRLFSLIMVVVFILGGCAIELPQSISVKTKAEYNFSIGKISTEFSDFFSINEIINSFNENENNNDEFAQGIKLYDYNPGKNSKNKQQFLVKIPVANVPIDFSEYFSETSLYNSIKESSFITEIAIPKLDVASSSQESLLSIQSAINTGVFFNGKTANNVSVNFNDFSYVDYSYGTFYINLQGENASEVKNVSLYDPDGNLVGYSENLGNSLYIDLSNVRISAKGMKLVFSGASGVDFVAFCDPSSKINAVKGVSKTFSLEIEPSVDLNLNDMGVSACEVKNGNILVDLNVPSEVGNLEISYKVVLSGAIEAESIVSNAKKEIDLSNKSINDGELKVKTLFDISLKDGPVNFDSYVTTMVGLSIESLKAISMRVNDVKTELIEKTPFSLEVKDFIKQVTLTSSGIKGKYTNELPKGNDITVYGKSDFLGLDDSFVLMAENSEKEFELLADETKKVRLIENEDGMDFNLSILLPGATKENPNVVTLKDVESGKKYKMEYIIEPVLNWTEIVLKQIEVESYKGDAEIPLNFNSSEFMSKFDGKIKPKEVFMYVFFDKPDLQNFNQLSFNNTRLDVYNVNADESGKSTDGAFTEISWEPTPKLEFEEDMVINDFGSIAGKEPIDITKEMEGLYKKNSSSTLKVSYNVEIALGSNSEVTITNDELKDSAVKSIGINAFIVLPLYFESTDIIDLSLSEMMGMQQGTDLLGRTEPPSENQMIEFLDAIESASLIYESTKLPLSFPESSPVRLKIALYGKDEPVTELGLDRGEIVVNPEKLMTTYPICPEVTLSIPKTSFSVTRDMGISLDIAMRINTNKTVKIWGGQ